MLILKIILSVIVLSLISIYIYDRFIQKKNLVFANFPLIGRFRYLGHELRPFVRQYFLDDNELTNRINIDWILKVAGGKSGYFGFDKFDSTRQLHDGQNQMIHSANPLNEDEMNPVFPLVGEKRKHPFQFKSYLYRSAMSLGAIGFEATAAMASACAKAGAPFNTGEGGFATQHIPNVKFSKDKKFFKYKELNILHKLLYKLAIGPRLKNYVLDFAANSLVDEGKQDLYLFCKENYVFYTIDWDADISAFPKYKDLDDSYGNIIFQIGSGLYGLKKHKADGTDEFNWDRFRKITSFCRAIEIKLAQGAKQSGGVLKAEKNTPTIAEIRGVEPGIDLNAPNRFPFYQKGGEKEFFEFIEKLSDKSGGKPVGIKIVISNESNILPLAKELAKNPKVGPDFITIDGGDGGSGAAPIALSVMFGKLIFEAIEIVNKVLVDNKVRHNVKVFASAKLFSPYLSTRALALGADAIGNARSIMISAGCIRAGLCSGEYGNCPVGLATMKKKNRNAYRQTWDKKVQQIENYIHAHNHGIVQVASIIGVDSPHKIEKKHIAKKQKKK